MGLFKQKNGVLTEIQLAGEDLGLAFQQVAMLWGTTWRQMLRADFEREHCGLSEQFCADLISFLQLFKGISPSLPVTTLLLTLSILKKLEPSDFEDMNEADFVQTYLSLEALPAEVDLPNSVALFEEYDSTGEEHPAILCASLFVQYLEEIAARDITLRNAPIVRLSKEHLEAFCTGGVHARRHVSVLDSQQAYELLGVSAGCTDAELKAAYNERVKQWHPDRLHEMAPELLEFANERLSAINAAYATLKGERTKGRDGSEEGDDRDRPEHQPVGPSARSQGAPFNPGPLRSAPEYSEAQPTHTWTGSTFTQMSSSAESIAWRYTKVFFRSVWRFFKILLTLALGVVIVAIAAASAVAHLAEYWRNEADSRQRPVSALRNFSTVYIISEFLGLPMLVVRGLLFTGSALLILFFVVGSAIWAFCLSHAWGSASTLIVFAACMFSWAVYRERTIEFEPSVETVAPSATGWVMGLIVTLCLAGGLPFVLSSYSVHSTSKVVALPDSFPATSSTKPDTTLAQAAQSDVNSVESSDKGPAQASERTQQTEEVGQVFSVEQNRASNCLEATDCWWTVTIEEPANTEWGLQTPSRPNLSKGQIIRAQVESTAREEREMTAGEVASHLPRLLSFSIVDPRNDHQAQDLQSTLLEERQALANSTSSEVRETAGAVPTSIVEAVSHWRTTVIDGNPEKEADCFAARVERYYLTTNINRDYIRAEIEKQISSADVQNTDIQIGQINADRVSDNYAEIDFIQTVKMLQKGLPKSPTVHTYMHFVLEQGVWKISFLRQFNLPA